MRPILAITAFIVVSGTGYTAEPYRDITVEVTPTDDGVHILCEIEYPEGPQHSSTTKSKLRGQCGNFIEERIIDKDHRYNGRTVLPKTPLLSLNNGTNRFEFRIRFRYFDYEATSNIPLEGDG